MNEIKWQMYCGCFGPMHFLYAKWQCDYNAYTTRCRIKNARDKWRNEIFIYAAYRITYTHSHTHTPTHYLGVCVKSEHTNHVQHINKCALCWAFKLKTSRLHGIAETIWEWNPFCCLCCRIPCKIKRSGEHWTAREKFTWIFTGYLAFVLLPLCLLFLLLFRLLRSNNNDCNLQKAKRIWSALAHTHTQLR